MLPTAVSKSQL